MSRCCRLRTTGGKRNSGLSAMGKYFYTLRGWADAFKTWSRDLVKKADAGQDLTLDLRTGEKFLAAAARRASGADAEKLNESECAASKNRRHGRARPRWRLPEDEDLLALMAVYRDRSADTVYEKELAVRVDRPRARFSSWYEMFPRSCTTCSRSGRDFAGLRGTNANTWRRWVSMFCICRRFIPSA